MKDNALFLLELVGASREVPLPSKQDNFQSQFGIQGIALLNNTIICSICNAISFPKTRQRLYVYAM